MAVTTSNLFALFGFTLAAALLIFLCAVRILIAVQRSFASRPPRIIKTPVLQAWPTLFSPRQTGLARRCAWIGVNSKKTVQLLACAGIIATAGVLLSIGWLAVLGLLILGGVYMYIFQKYEATKKRFITGLPDALLILIGALKAGFALPDALAVVERESSAPTRLVFASLVRAHTLRISLDRAVLLLDEALRVPEWTLVADSLAVLVATGGNMIPVLTDLAQTLRDKLHVEREIQTATAAGRLSGLIISLLAPASFIFFLVFSPQFVIPLLNTNLGQLLLILALVLEVAGFVVIWRITKIDF
jgi:Flp pilus assembly protein TadB